MRFLTGDRRGWRLSIPIKVVLSTALAYVALWGIGFALERTDLVDFQSPLFGIELRHYYVALEIMIVALAATFGTHAFLDRPLARLTGVMSCAEEGDFLVRAPVLANDELGELSRTFNRMLSRLTDLTANKIQSDHDLLLAQEQLRFKASLEEKNTIIERSNSTLEQLVRDLSLLHEIGQEVNSIIDLEKLYAKITETLQRYLRINEFTILVYDDKHEELHVRAAYGFPDNEAIFRTIFRRGEGITGLVADTGRKIYIKDTARDDRFLNYKGGAPMQNSSFLSIPLVYKGEVLGVINFRRIGVGSFSAQDVRMLSLVAGQVALAIANARLYTRTRELSVRDELTGINNRRYFDQMLQMEWKRAVRFKRSLSLIMVDVDHFKEYNDTFGHLQGDEVLRQIGAVLKRNLREVDTVARFGGEEFVLLLPDTDKRGAIAVAEKVRLLVEQHAFMTAEKTPTRQVTISAGIASFPDDGGDMGEFVDHADEALYRSKDRGRNVIECYRLPASGEEKPAFPEEPILEQRRREIKKPETVQ